VGDWFDLVKVEYRVLFPKLPHRTRYYRVLKRLERIFADFSLRFSGSDTFHVIDSKPLPICLGQNGTCLGLEAAPPGLGRSRAYPL